MAGPARDAVLGAENCLGFRLEIDAVRRPRGRIAEIVLQIGECVFQAEFHAIKGADKPVAGGDMAVAAGRPHAHVVAPMPRALEIWIVGLQDHDVALRAKRIARIRVVVDRNSRDYPPGADAGGNQQQGAQEPAVDLHP